MEKQEIFDWRQTDRQTVSNSDELVNHTTS